MLRSSLTSALFAGLLVLTLVPALAAQPTLVADLGSVIPATRQETFSGLALTAVLEGVAYFLYDDGIHGRELWRSDGRQFGTFLVADACPGECGAAWSFSQDALVATSDAVFFAASDGVHGEELWISDGTLAGTRMVRDIASGLRSGAPTTLRRVGERVFFVATDEATGRELWVSDGTEAGTQRVTDLAPGPAGISVSTAIELGGNLLFGLDSQAAAGLWRSDGTAAGTVQISTVQPWQQNYTANSAFDVVNGRLVFRGDDADATFDPTLWVSDGTPGGTQELAALADPGLFVRFGDEIFFATPGFDGGIYRTDGTVPGTFQIPLPAGTRVTLNAGYAAASATLVFFGALDEIHGRELWATDGTSAWLVADIWPGTGFGLNAILGPFYAGSVPGVAGFGDRVAFFADDGIHGRELWGSDGTPQGTSLLVDLTPGPVPTLSDAASSYLPPASLSSGILLRPVSGDGPRDLWRTDGTPAGTTSVVSLRTQTSGFLPFAAGTIVFANPELRRCFIPVADGVLFSIRGAADRWELWFANGAPPSAQPVESLESDPNFDEAPYCRSFGGGAVLEANVEIHGGMGLFKTSGSFGSLAPIVLGSRPGAWMDADAVQDEALYIGGTSGVWRTDGTPTNTLVYQTPVSDGPAELEAFGDRVLVAGYHLFITSKDRSALDPIDVGSAEFPLPLKLASAGERAYFLAFTEAEGTELWATDGTSLGTTLVRDIRPGPDSAFFEEAPGEGRTSLSTIVPLGARAVFAADDGVHGEELWTTDGTFDGTTLLADLVSGGGSSSPRELTRLGEWAYFVAEGAALGRELWRTNGTPDGTELVADLVAGAGSSIPQQLTRAGSELYFSAWLPGYGREPWRLRENPGTAPLLAPLGDVAPGSLSSSPLAFLEVGGRVFFPANDNVRGFELWSVQEPDSVFSDGFESSGTAVWSQALP